MEPQMAANPEEDLLAALEPPDVNQYWLSEEELKAITIDPDLSAAFGNPYVPAAVTMDPTRLHLDAPDLVMPTIAGSVHATSTHAHHSAAHIVTDSPTPSPVSSPQYPQSPTSASSAAGSGDDDGSEEARPTAASVGKRRRTAEEKDINLSFLNISKEQLQIISSKQLDDTVARLVASGRKLAADEKKAVTAARRRIKNREYARDLRDKQSRQMTDLSGRVLELEAENHTLKSQVSALMHENAMLKTQLGISTPAYQPPQATGRSVLGKRGTPQVAAGACLLVLLLSFGFYFNFTSPTPFDSTLQGRSGVSTGRVLLHDAEPVQWSLIGALQRAVFAFRYGGTSSACQCEEHFKGLVCVDKDDFKELGWRCDLSGITRHEE